MRVVAGSARGRRLEAPAGSNTRPTSDRVREAVFNALSSLDAIAEATVLDGFAGSGAMGLEALSRGAAHATFVESDRRAAEVIRRNIAACGFGDRSTVVTQPLERYLAHASGPGVGATNGPGSSGPGSSASTGRRFDLVILDPPYAYDGWDELIASLDADVLVVESDREIALGDAWDVVRDRTYGSTVVRIAERRSARSEFQE